MPIRITYYQLSFQTNIVIPAQIFRIGPSPAYSGDSIIISIPRGNEEGYFSTRRLNSFTGAVYLQRQLHGPRDFLVDVEMKLLRQGTVTTFLTRIYVFITAHSMWSTLSVTSAFNKVLSSWGGCQNISLAALLNRYGKKLVQKEVWRCFFFFFLKESNSLCSVMTWDKKKKMEYANCKEWQKYFDFCLHFFSIIKITQCQMLFFLKPLWFLETFFYSVSLLFFKAMLPGRGRQWGGWSD